MIRFRWGVPILKTSRELVIEYQKNSGWGSIWHEHGGKHGVRVWNGRRATG
jgi:hypothetical protein